MDFILDEEIEKVYEAEKIEVAKVISDAKASTDFSLKTETYASKHELYMRLPNKLIIAVVRYLFMTTSVEHKEIGEFLAGPHEFNKLSAVKCIGLAELDPEFNSLGWDWLIKRLEKGWNSGCIASDFLELNHLAASRAQLEFIPVEELSKGLFAHKVRYNAVPYLPYKGTHYGVNFAFRMGKDGLEPRLVPLNLNAALLKAGKIWKPAPLAAAYLKAANGYMPGLLRNHTCMAYALGANIDRLNAAYREIDSSVALTIEPHRKERSIFAGVYLPLWSAFFEGFAEDTVGPVSPARMLAALPYTAYYGKIDDVAIWSTKPKVIKTPNKLESIVKHVYVDYTSFNHWPADALVYNPTPQELNSYVHANGPPVALAMPLTAVISNSPQVDFYCSSYSKIVLEVYCCTTPIVIFRPAQKDESGLDGRGMKDELIALEKAIVKGFLDLIKIKVTNSLLTGFSIGSNDDYSVGKCSVKINLLERPASRVCTRFMSMTDAELKRFVPTARITDVVIDGVSVAKGDKTLVPQYPRAMPTTIIYDKPIKIGYVYEKDDLSYIGGPLTFDIYNWTVKSAVDSVKEVPKGSYVKVGKAKGEEAPPAADAPAPAAEERKEEAAEIVEEEYRPASPTYVPFGDITEDIKATIEELAAAERVGMDI